MVQRDLRLLRIVMNSWMKVSMMASVAAALATACGGATDPGVSAGVRFVIDAPFCGNSYPVNFFIDNVQVGRDTMWFGFVADTQSSVAGLHKFKWYRSFGLRAGTHQLRAAIVDTIPSFPPFIYNWPDTTITVPIGGEVVRKLSFYCS
jgi:hypothetical protein